MKEAQQVVAEKTSALEAEAYKTKRLQVSYTFIYKLSMRSIKIPFEFILISQ